MKPKRSTPVRGGDERRRRQRQQSPRTPRRTGEAQARGTRPTREPRQLRSAPQTTPVQRPVDAPSRPKSARQAKARAKARKAKAPKVVRPPLRVRMISWLASIELNPRVWIARVPFVVLVIGSLGLGLGITLWLSTSAAERSYQLGHARQTNQALLQQKEALERDVLEAQAAPALAEAARNLGMIPSRDTAHLVQDAAGNWVVVGTPKPAEGVPPPPLNRPLSEDLPAPPPPPAAAPPPPRVVDPREVTVRLPEVPQVPAQPLGAATVPEVAHVPAGAPTAPGPAPEAAAAPAPEVQTPAAAPAPVAPDAAPAPAPVVADAAPAPVPTVQAPPVAVPGVPTLPGPPHLPDTQVPPQPGPAAGTEQFAPALPAPAA